MTMTVDTPCLRAVMLHYVGSKNNLDALRLSTEPLSLDEESLQLLQGGLLERFRTIPEQFAFAHPTSLQYNEVYSYCRQLFADPEQLVHLSGAIARHLYEASTHPKVKGGEFYLAYFEGLPVESRMHKAIGLFKTENKTVFLDVEEEEEGMALAMKEGVELARIDKGCLIINTAEEEGYTVMIFDNQNRGEEARYWRETFLGLEARKNEFHQTSHFLSLTRQFITEQLDAELALPRTEQVELLNRSIDYFKSREAFDIEEFQQEVFANEEMIGSFRDFGSRYLSSQNVDIAASFDISTDAVKKQARIFKSVVKLDKNFHIYIHGRTDLIEKGVEGDGRKFYKIYYQEES
jgi:hypothetical protein